MNTAPKTLIVDFVGGIADGETLVGKVCEAHLEVFDESLASIDADEDQFFSLLKASAVFQETKGGTIGESFNYVGPQHEQKSCFPILVGSQTFDLVHSSRHRYRVAARLEDGDEILIQASYIGPTPSTLLYISN